MLAEGEQEDFFDCAHADASELDVFTTVRAQEKLRKDGYRVHKARAEDAHLQRGFDEGFAEGADVGQTCGTLYAMCRVRGRSRESSGSSDSYDIDGAIKVIDTLLLKTLPERGCLSPDQVRSLRASVLLLSLEFEPQLEALLRCLSLHSS